MEPLIRLFEDLKKTNQAGVYCLVNNVEKTCYISYSSNISKSLVRLLSSSLYFPEFEFKILEIVTEPINLRPRCQFFKDLYSSNKWSIINPNRVSNWKLHISVIDDLKRLDHSKGLFRVYVSSKGYKEITVGVFDLYRDVEVFCAQNYSNGKVYSIIKSSNELTLEYLKYVNKTT
jgi:hypothetical protein